jgi:hypothetical protein
MSTSQAGILADVPSLSRYLEFTLLPDTDPAPVLRDLASRKLGADMVIGIGPAMPMDGARTMVAAIHPRIHISGPR